MLRRLIPVLSLFVSALTILSIVSEAQADRATRQARRASRGGLFGRRVQTVNPNTPVVDQGQVRSMPTPAQQQAVGYRSYYRQPTPDAPAGTVLLNVQVPENAKITIDGAQTTSTGAARQFVTPQLTPGREYMTEIKASWDGKQVTRRIPVQAGQAVVVNFLQPTPEELRAPTKSRDE